MPFRWTAPPIRLRHSFWKSDGDHFYVEKGDLLAAIEQSSANLDMIKYRMGHGFHHIQDLLDGKRVDKYGASFVENGIRDLSDEDKKFQEQHLNKSANPKESEP